MYPVISSTMSPNALKIYQIYKILCSQAVSDLICSCRDLDLQSLISSSLHQILTSDL